MKINGEKEKFFSGCLLKSYITKEMPVGHTADIMLP